MERKHRLRIAKKARKLAAEGMKWKEVAKKFNVSPSTLRNYRKELREAEKAGEEGTKEGNIIDKAISGTDKGRHNTTKQQEPDQEPEQDQNQEPEPTAAAGNKEQGSLINAAALQDNLYIILAAAITLGLVVVLLKKKSSQKQAESKEVKQTKKDQEPKPAAAGMNIKAVEY